MFGSLKNCSVLLGFLGLLQLPTSHLFAAEELPLTADTSILGPATLRVWEDGRQEILYNPIFCDILGKDACFFYIMHEFGHIQLRHVYNKVPSEISEIEADCWAAKRAPPDSVKAVYRLFRDGYPSPEVHGSSPERAERIKKCAGF